MLVCDVEKKHNGDLTQHGSPFRCCDKNEKKGHRRGGIIYGNRITKVPGLSTIPTFRLISCTGSERATLIVQISSQPLRIKLAACTGFTDSTETTPELRPRRKQCTNVQVQVSTCGDKFFLKAQIKRYVRSRSVSYTHLTLPTKA